MTWDFGGRGIDALHPGLVGKLWVQTDVDGVYWLHVRPVQAVADQVTVPVLGDEA